MMMQWTLLVKGVNNQPYSEIENKRCDRSKEDIRLAKDYFSENDNPWISKL